MIRPIAHLTAAAGLALAGSLGAATAAQAMPSDLHPCTDDQITVNVVYDGSGMSKSHYRVEMTNTSQRSCTLRGFPGVDHEDEHGIALGAPAARAEGDTRRSVEMAPGDRAAAPLTITSAGVFDPAACRPGIAPTLTVYIPGGFEARQVALRHDACLATDFANMRVGAVARA